VACLDLLNDCSDVGLRRRASLDSATESKMHEIVVFDSLLFSSAHKNKVDIHAMTYIVMNTFLTQCSHRTPHKSVAPKFRQKVKTS
jgi:hypothetical protein